MMKRLSAALLLVMLLMLCVGAQADTEFTLENGYALTLPDGWIEDAPSAIAIRDVNAGERAIRTFYADAAKGGGYRIDVYVGTADMLADVDMASFRDRLRVYERLREYFASYTDFFWTLDRITAASGVELFMNYVYEPDDEYLMTFTFQGDAYTGFVYYQIDDALKNTLPLTDADYDWFEGVMRSVRAQ